MGKTDFCHCLVDKITARGILFVYCRCWTIPVQVTSKMCLEGCFVRCGALIFVVPMPKNYYLCKECEREPGADVSCPPDCGGENQQSRCVRTPGAASPSCAAADATEADPLSEQARCVLTPDAASPYSAATDATGADHLPEAIAPSLAATPDFARRNTSWCHAIEVGD